MSAAPLRPVDLAEQAAVGQVALSPDGKQVAYTLRTVVAERDRVDLWLVPFDGSAPPRQLTGGPSWDVTPRWSPDGRRIAFVRDEGAAVVAAGAEPGEEPLAVAAPPGVVVDVAWTAGGEALVALVEEPAGGDVAIEIARIDWRHDEEDPLPRRPRHLHLLALDGGPARRLTSGPWSASRPRVADDGAVLFLADPRPRADLEPAPQVQRIALDGDGPARPLTDLAGGVVRYAAEHGGALVVLGHERARPADADPPQAWRVLPDGRRERLAPGCDRWLGQFGTCTDLHDWCTDLDDAGAVTGMADGGRVVPVRLTAGGADPLVDPALEPLAGALDARAGSVVAALTLSAGVGAPDLYALEPAGPRRLTAHGGAWLKPFALPPVERRELAGPGGAIAATLVHPPGAGDEPRATVLLIHGGPTEQWGAVPPLEAVLLAGAGYRVVLPNIRGSYDRGAPWVAALAGRWGGPDAADCHAVLDALVAEGLADPARLGVSGLSYGGFLVNWLIGTSDRFAAAVSENGVVNQVSAWANCDVGAVYARAAGLGEPTAPAGVDALWRQSPLRHVAAIRTPLLLLQGAEDRRCPAADAEQLFVALRWLGRDVRYVLYPDERHLFQAVGRYDRRADRHARVLAWFGERMPA